MNVLVVVEDEPDVRMLVRVMFSKDSRFEISGEVSTASDAIELALKTHPELIVLDHGLDGEMTGLDAAPLLKKAAPDAKIILFTAYHSIKVDASNEPAIDAFVLKPDINNLVRTACRLLGIEAPPKTR